MRLIMTTDIVASSPQGQVQSPGHRTALPASLPRPVKVTRNRRIGPPPPAHVRVIGGAIDDEDRDYIARKLGMKLFPERFDELSDRIFYVGHEGVSLGLRHEGKL